MPKQLKGQSTKKVDRQDKEALIRRMNRISGQVSGITKMIEEDRYCVDILNQVTAAKSALTAVAMQVLTDHTKNCVQDAILSKKKGNEIIEELIDVIKKFSS